MTDMAKKAGYIAFKVGKIEVVETTNDFSLDAGVPTDAKFN